MAGHLEIVELANYNVGCNHIGLHFYHKVSFSIGWHERLYSGHSRSLASITASARRCESVPESPVHKAGRMAFADAIDAVLRGLPPGDCNLYKFPQVKPKDAGKEVRASPSLL